MNDCFLNVSSWKNCYNRALDLLARREHSAGELEKKLIDKGFSVSDAVITLEKLQFNNLQCNQRFTEAYVRSRVLRGFGSVKIANELYQRHVTEAMAVDVLDDYSDQWLSIGDDVYLKKYRHTKVVDYNEWTKRARFLQSRGFTSDQIRKIVDFDGVEFN